MPLRVLEFGIGPAAGYCGRLFALWDAEVIRVDTADGGHDVTVRETAEDYYLHGGKKRVGLDYSNTAGRELLNQLAAQCDVLVTDESPSVLDELNWTSLGDANPTLIRVSITPFGLSGPYRNWQGPGPVLQAMGGYTYIVGDPDREPLTIPGNYVEYQAGQYAYVGAMTALLEGSSRSRLIEVSMLETVLSLSQFTTSMWTTNREIRGRHGNGWANLHPINLYPCKDGWFFVNIVPTFWKAFTQMLGRPGLLEDPRFARSADRVTNRAALDDIIVECLGDYTMDELLEMGQRQFRVPTGTLFSMADVLEHEHLHARSYFHLLEDEDGGRFQSPASPFRYVTDNGIRAHPGFTIAPPGTGSGAIKRSPADG